MIVTTRKGNAVMKRYIRNSQSCITCSTNDTELLNTRIEDLFKELKSSIEELYDAEDEDTLENEQIADYIAQHMVEFRNYDEWFDIALAWLNKQ